MGIWSALAVFLRDIFCMDQNRCGEHVCGAFGASAVLALLSRMREIIFPARATIWIFSDHILHGALWCVAPHCLLHVAQKMGGSAFAHGFAILLEGLRDFSSAIQHRG